MPGLFLLLKRRFGEAAQLGSQVRRLANSQATIVRHKDAGRATELVPQRIDLLLLLSSSEHGRSYSATRATALWGSIRSPGPIVVEMAIRAK